MKIRIPATLTLIALSVLLSSAAHARQFGVDGRDGMDGRSGFPGRDGQDAVITATGQSVVLDLSGTDGGDGGDGEDGDDAWACNQPTPAENVWGADGGDGGRAGAGGRGGDGGDLVVYTDDLRNLRMVTVRSGGGSPGRSGTWGRGGRPCYCTYANWKHDVCERVKQPDGTYKTVCKSYYFSCRPGRHGDDGWSAGSSGPRGSMGTLTLIKQLQPLAPTQSSLTVSLPQLVTSAQTLSRNVWVRKGGALGLFAPGSVISDVFQEFSHRQEYRSEYLWNANRPVTDFAGVSATLTASATDNGTNLSLPSSFWFVAREQWVGNVERTTFDAAVDQSEVTRLSLSFYGFEAGFIAKVRDAANLSDLLETGFTAELQRERALGDKTLFKGPVDPSYVERVGSDFTLRLGALPGVDPKDLKKGTEVELKLTVHRGLGRFGTDYEMAQKYKIPK